MPHPCKYCDASFNDPLDLGRHIRHQHPEAVQERKPTRTATQEAADGHQGNGARPARDGLAGHQVAVDELEPHAKAFLEVGMNLGVPRNTAAPVAAYMAANVDLDNPNLVWEGLRRWPELSPNARLRWWETWCSKRGLNVPVDLASKVYREGEPKAGPAPAAAGPAPSANGKGPRYTVDEDTGEIHRVPDGEEGYGFWEARARSRDIQQRNLQQMRAQGRRFYVIGSQIFPVEEGEDGFSYAEAVTLAQQNWERELERERQALERERLLAQPKGTDEGVLASVLKVLLEKDTGSGELVEARIREVEAKMEGEIKLLQQTQQHFAENLTSAINGLKDALVQRQAQPPQDPLDSLKRTMEVMEMLEARARGEPIDDKAAWRQDRRMIVKTFREYFPDFIDAGRKVAEATKMQVQAQGQRQRVMQPCPGCGTVLRFEAGSTVVCPRCGTTFGPGAGQSAPRPAPQQEEGSAQAGHRPGHAHPSGEGGQGEAEGPGGGMGRGDVPPGGSGGAPPA